MTSYFKQVWNDMSSEEKNVLVCNYLKELPKWELKRMLCNVLDVEHYMDDEGLRKATEAIINVR